MSEAAMFLVLSTLLILGQDSPKADSSQKDGGPRRPSIAHLLPHLKDLGRDQSAQIKKIMDDFAAQLAELEAERDSRLAAVLTKSQREALAAIAAEETARYRVILLARFARPVAVAKPFKDILGLDVPQTRARLEAAPGKPVAEDLPRSKADALVKALNAAGAKAAMERQEKK